MDDKIERLCDLLLQIPGDIRNYSLKERVTLVDFAFCMFPLPEQVTERVGCVAGRIIKAYEEDSGIRLQSQKELDMFIQIAKCIVEIVDEFGEDRNYIEKRERTTDILMYKLHSKTIKNS